MMYATLELLLALKRAFLASVSRYSFCAAASPFGVSSMVHPERSWSHVVIASSTYGLFFSSVVTVLARSATTCLKAEAKRWQPLICALSTRTRTGTSMAGCCLEQLASWRQKPFLN